MDNQEIKPLTDAQIRHLQHLVRNRNAAQAQMDQFMSYLRLEHGTQDEKWALRTVEEGFVRECDEPPSG